MSIMQLKVYRGPDLPSALEQARNELGPHALVLKTSELRGRSGLDGVEVTVGWTESAPADDRPPLLRRTTEALVASGLSDDLALRFARIAARDLGPRADTRSVVAAAARGLESLLPFSPIPLSARCLFVVGPPGVGKTTTVAKIATRLASGSSRPVIWAEADAERVGALEQAEILCRHIGVTIKRIGEPEDLSRLLDRAAPNCQIVVDTAGVGAGDLGRLQDLARLRRVAPRAELAVLLPSGAHRDEARSVLARFAPLSPTCAALARVDDGGRLGELVSALADTDIPLAFVTNGHRVPDDLAPASARGLTAILLKHGERAVAAGRRS